MYHYAIDKIKNKILLNNDVSKIKHHMYIRKDHDIPMSKYEEMFTLTTAILSECNPQN